MSRPRPHGRLLQPEQGEERRAGSRSTRGPALQACPPAPQGGAAPAAAPPTWLWLRLQPRAHHPRDITCWSFLTPRPASPRPREPAPRPRAAPVATAEPPPLLFAARPGRKGRARAAKATPTKKRSRPAWPAPGTALPDVGPRLHLGPGPVLPAPGTGAPPTPPSGTARSNLDPASR